MDKFSVTGMSCAACSAHVEKAVLEVPGVTSVTVSLLTNSMNVEGTAAPSDVIQAVITAGYGASLQGGERNNVTPGFDEEGLKDHETPKLRKRLISSVVILIPLMYVSMGHMMWNWPLPSFLAGNHVAIGLYQMLLTILVMVINQKFFISGFTSLLHKAPNMDTLVALGSGASFAYSTYALFAMTGAQMRMDMDAVMHYMDEFYFESAAMILTLITVGKMLEAYSKGKTTNALKSLMELAPKKATIFRDGEEVLVPVEQVQIGDIFVVRPGEGVPVDGVILEGNSALNESTLTGESIPVDKAEGDSVSAGTLNQSGFLKCRATRIGNDTTLSQIIQMVSDAAATKAPIAKVADKVSGVFVPAVITIAAVTIIAWLLVGADFGFALARGISVLVISCPCALGLATPVAIMVGNGVGAKSGVLFKTAVSLEETGKVDIVVLDKTGTITRGEPKVTDIIPGEGIAKDVLVRTALALELKSEHPLAKAIVVYGEEQKIAMTAADEFQVMPGNGLSGLVSGVRVFGGSLNFISEKSTVSKNMQHQAEELAKQGKTPLFFATEQKLLGIIAVADVIREDSPQAISQLQNMGIQVVMLTGDNERTARAIGAQAGVDEVIAGVLPDGKESVIRSLKEQGKVAMVGDGINDAPALTRADIGIAIGAGTDIAIDAADVVLMKSRLSDVPAAIRLSRATLRNIHENLFWAFFYNVVGIPLAAGLWYPIFGWKLNPMFGAAAMSLSSFCVVTNALRLNLFKMHDASKDHPMRKRAEKTANKGGEKAENAGAVRMGAEDTRSIGQTANENETVSKKMQKSENQKNHINMEGITMTKTMNIEGMMCGHCEARVKKALEALAGVESAEVSHEKGTAVVSMSADVADDTLKEAVEAQDYKVDSIQ